MFITFEGIDGSGKTAHVARLCAKLRQKFGVDNVVQTCEPDKNSELGRQIRDLIKNNDTSYELDVVSQVLLFTVARYVHCKNMLYDALKSGVFVVSDRYVDSTVAYQLYGGNFYNDSSIDDKIRQLVELALSVFPIPDLTFVLDTDIGLSRRLVARRKDIFHGQFVSNQEFFQNVVSGYKSIVRDNPKRCVVIRVVDDDSRRFRDIDAISEEIWQCVCMRCEQIGL